MTAITRRPPGRQPSDYIKLLLLGGIGVVILLQLAILNLQAIKQQQQLEDTAILEIDSRVLCTSSSSSKAVDTPKFEYPFYRPIQNLTLNTFDGIIARPFATWRDSLNQLLPCVPAEPKWNYSSVQNTMTDKGLLYMSLYKTGSTTAAGVNLRLGRVLGREFAISDPQRFNSTFAQGYTPPHHMCLVRYRHHHAYKQVTMPRDKLTSFLWTTVRDPTRRIVSQYFYGLSEKYESPSDENFIKYLQYLGYNQERDLLYKHYISRLALRPFGKQDKTHETENRPRYNSSRIAGNDILTEYDFVGIMERMDESLVALAMLLKIPITHVLYLKANKGQGEFSLGARSNTCNYLTPSFVTTGMHEYFRGDYWQNHIYWDHVFYKAANRSLDLTIAALGKSEFDKNMKLYKQARERARDYCTHVQFPCTEGGVRHNNSDCMFLDSGCGNDCLDEVAAMMRDERIIA